jgi:hypothetical protein
MYLDALSFGTGAGPVASPDLGVLSGQVGCGSTDLLQPAAILKHRMGPEPPVEAPRTST